MSSSYHQQCKNLHTILDFFRFGLSKANASQLFYGHGTDNAWDDIQTLVLESLSLDRNLDLAYWQAALSDTEKEHLAQQLEKRIIQRIPVPYLTQMAYFCDLAFYVDERVLIPRSPIAELINKQFSPWIDDKDVHRVLDMCTGSGCIAIACCYAFPNAMVDAIDLDSDALEVAAINQERFELSEQLNLIQSDCFDAAPEAQYDIIVSNPPYVGQAEMDSLPHEYTHEPVKALQASQNGLAIVQKILGQANQFLSDKGILVVEVGNSAEILMEIYPQVPFTWLEFEYGGQGVFLLTKDQLEEYFANE